MVGAWNFGKRPGVTGTKTVRKIEAFQLIGQVPIVLIGREDMNVIHNTNFPQSFAYASDRW